MRKPRVIIFYDGAETKKALKRFFDVRGYERVVVAQSEFCPFYSPHSSGSRVCCDMVVVVEKREHRKAGQILISQSHLDCRLKPCNRAVITKGHGGQGDVVKATGAKVFRDPLDIDEFEAWVRGCEPLMHLSLPLAIRRKAPRRACPADTKVHYRVLKRGNEILRAYALNESSCGICIKTRHMLKPGQVLHLWSEEPLLSEDAEVRWVQKVEDGTHLIGLTFCVD
jgi:hypothetical protein